MKAFRLIFALYILTLSVYPCNDEGSCADEQKAGITIVNTSDHDHNPTEQDNCTPLCICSCCAASVRVTANDIKMPLGVDHATKLIIPYRDKALLNHPQAIWQPPKLS